MAWSASAPTLPSGASWSGWTTSGESIHVNNYYNFRIRSRIARGGNNTIYVAVQLQVYGYNYGSSYPYVTIPLKAQVSVGNTSSYSASSAHDCGGAYGAWTTAKTWYYTGTAASGAKVYARGAWNSNYCGVNTHTAPGYVTAYAVTYHANGGEGTTEAQSKTYGQALTLRQNAFTRTGWVFDHWNTAADDTGTRYAAGASYTANAALALYAVWKPDAYAVTYYPNGGEGITEPQSKTYGQALTLRECAYTRTGWHFVRWNTAANGLGTSYAPGASYTVEAALTLYAIWERDTYAVTYEPNGAESGATSAQTKSYAVALTLNDCGFVRRGWAFTGWNTAPDGTGTAYAAGASYTVNAPLALYAQWVRTSLPVYVNAGGTVVQVERAWANVGGTLRECEILANVDGVIRRFS